MSRLITLHEFIVTNQSHFPYATGELSRLLNDIVLASKVVSNDVRKAGLVEHILGAQGGQNVQGEEQQKLDVVADEAFILTARTYRQNRSKGHKPCLRAVTEPRPRS